MAEEELRFADLHERHPAVGEVVAKYFAEAAAVCLDRHHGSPQSFCIVESRGETRAAARWPAPDERIIGSWANNRDIAATEAGAYALALAAVELTRGLVALTPGETASGCDYYVGVPGALPKSLQGLIRLEISGVDEGEPSRLSTRQKQKIRQLTRGRSKLPGIAATVGFKTLRILLTEKDEP